METTAFREGWNAKVDGYRLSNNPYPRGTCGLREWAEGWKAADELLQDNILAVGAIAASICGYR